jgi:hypothetical protein
MTLPNRRRAGSAVIEGQKSWLVVAGQGLEAKIPRFAVLPMSSIIKSFISEM